MPLRNIQIDSTAINKLSCPQIQDITDQLPVNPNYTWQELTDGPRDLNALTTIVVHHDAISKAETDGLSDMQVATNIANSHIRLTKNEAKGDGGFPYHCWIRSGQAYQTNDLLTFTYGVASNNAYTVHICVHGNYADYDTLTDQDRAALYGAILAVKAQLPNFTEIKAHCELGATSCPGYDYNQVRDDIKTLEMKIARDNTLQARRERAFAVVNQCQYMYGFVGKNDGDEEWSLNYLDDVYDIMKSKGLL
jgi:hypothetical protein